MTRGPASRPAPVLFRGTAVCFCWWSSRSSARGMALPLAAQGTTSRAGRHQRLRPVRGQSSGHARSILLEERRRLFPTGPSRRCWRGRMGDFHHHGRGLGPRRPDEPRFPPSSTRPPSPTGSGRSSTPTGSLFLSFLYTALMGLAIVLLLGLSQSQVLIPLALLGPGAGGHRGADRVGSLPVPDRVGISIVFYIVVGVVHVIGRFSHHPAGDGNARLARHHQLRRQRDHAALQARRRRPGSNSPPSPGAAIPRRPG